MADTPDNPLSKDLDALLAPHMNSDLVPMRSGHPIRSKPRHTKRYKPRGDYLSQRVKRAIEAIIFDGKERDEAAALVGLKDTSLRTAFAMPKVRAYHSLCLQVLRDGGRAKGLRKIMDLTDTAKSENVQLQAAKYLDSEGNSDRSQVTVNVGINNAPGYVIDMGEDAKDVTQIALLSGSTSNCLDNTE